jgi:hypothetical protein
MELPNKSMAAFYKRETPNVEYIVPHTTTARAADMSTGRIKSFADLEGAQYSTGGWHTYRAARTCISLAAMPCMLCTGTKTHPLRLAMVGAITKGGKYHPKLNIGPSRSRISRRVTPFFHSSTGRAALLIIPQFMASEWDGRSSI